MSGKMPPLDKRRISVVSLRDTEEDRKYWWSLTPAERLSALEISRRMIYGEGKCSVPMVKKVIEFIDLKDR